MATNHDPADDAHFGGSGQWLSAHFDQELHIKPDFEAIEAIAVERLAGWAQIDGLNALTRAEKRELMGFRPQHNEGEDHE